MVIPASNYRKGSDQLSTVLCIRSLEQIAFCYQNLGFLRYRFAMHDASLIFSFLSIIIRSNYCSNLQLLSNIQLFRDLEKTSSFDFLAVFHFFTRFSPSFEPFLIHLSNLHTIPQRLLCFCSISWAARFRAQGFLFLSMWSNIIQKNCLE